MCMEGALRHDVFLAAALPLRPRTSACFAARCTLSSETHHVQRPKTQEKRERERQHSGDEWVAVWLEHHLFRLAFRSAGSTSVHPPARAVPAGLTTCADSPFIPPPCLHAQTSLLSCAPIFGFCFFVLLPPPPFFLPHLEGNRRAS